MSGKMKKLMMTVIMMAVLVLGSLSSMQTEALASEKTGSITVDYPAADVKFYLYYVGVADKHDGYDLTEAFAAYGLNLRDEGVADLLADYVVRDQLEADETAVTDADGSVSFTDLKQGVYLIFADKVEVDNKRYESVPTFVEIPNWQDNTLIYDINIQDKWEESDLTELTVVKLWKNDNESDRPESVVVQLTQDGEAVKEVTLTADNNWTCTWENLDPQYTWNVLEKSVPDGYEVSREIEQSQAAITNTYITPDQPETSSDTSNPGDETSSTSSSSSSSSSSTKLPQTGQLWWPVSVLLIAGLAMILIGLLVKRKDN